MPENCRTEFYILNFSVTSDVNFCEVIEQATDAGGVFRQVLSENGNEKRVLFSRQVERV